MRQDFYGVDDPIPPWLAFTLGIQHVLGMFVGIITPPLLVGTAIGLPLADVAYLVSMSLFTSGLTTLVQVARFGPLGSGLLSVTGPSFAFVSLAIATGKERGMAMVFGLSMAGSVVPMLVSATLQKARRLFPPLVTGTAIALIGFTLVRVGFSQLGGIPHAADYGSPANFALGMFVIVVIVATQAFGRGWLRSLTIALGLLAGYLAALLSGHVGSPPDAPWLRAPMPLKYGLAFDPAYLLPWLMAYLLVALECIGDLTATSSVSRQPVEGDLFQSRVRGGLLADGLGCIVTSFFNALPKTTFAQNNGIIAMTGVASRRVGLAAGAILMMLGLVPKLAALISVVPAPVLGGATLMMFATVATAGLQIVSRDGYSPRNQFILAVSLGLGLGPTMCPEALDGLRAALAATALPPGLVQSLRIFLESGMAVGTLAATVLNLVVPPSVGLMTLDSLVDPPHDID